MIYFILHHLFKIIPIINQQSDTRINCYTFLFGSISYFLLYGLLQNYRRTPFLKTIHNFFIYFVIVDAITMAILYKNYYSRSIIAEVTDDPDKWDWDDETHTYRKTKTSQLENYFDHKIQTLEQTSDTLINAEEKIEELDEAKDKLDKIDKLEENLEELDMAFKYRPEGDLAQQIEQDWDKHVNDQSQT